MTLNLEADIGKQMRTLDPTQWTALQAEVCMTIANAKLYAFVAEAERLAEFVRLGLMSRAGPRIICKRRHSITRSALNTVPIEYRKSWRPRSSARLHDGNDRSSQCLA